MSIPHAQELVIINNDPSKFRYINKHFNGNVSVDSSVSRSQIKKILNTSGIMMTNQFIRLVSSKFGPESPEYKKASKLPMVNLSSYEPNLQGSDRTRYERLAKDSDVPIVSKSGPTQVASASESKQLQERIGSNPVILEPVIVTEQVVPQLQNVNEELEGALKQMDESKIQAVQEEQKKLAEQLRQQKVDKKPVLTDRSKLELEVQTLAKSHVAVLETADNVQKLESEKSYFNDTRENIMNQLKLTDEKLKKVGLYGMFNDLMELIDKKVVNYDNFNVLASEFTAEVDAREAEMADKKILNEGRTLEEEGTLLEEMGYKSVDEMLKAFPGFDYSDIRRAAETYGPVPSSEQLRQILYDLKHEGETKTKETLSKNRQEFERFRKQNPNMSDMQILLHLENLRKNTQSVAGSVSTFQPSPESPESSEPGLTQEVSQPSQPSEPIGPETIQFGIKQSVSEHQAKYHTSSILFYFGSKTNPDWDTELEKNVFDSGYNSDDIITGIDSIIDRFGSELFVYERKSESLEEFHELIQLQFCLLRNLQRGTRTKMAMVPISSLTGFANKLSGQSQPIDQQRNDLVQPLESDIPESASQVDNQQQIGSQPVNNPVSEQVQLSTNQAIDNIVEKFRNRPYDTFGKPIYNQDIIKQTKVHHYNIIGSNNMKDPVNQYKQAFKLNVSSKKI